jgi:single-strand DNA-binding protein
MNSCSFIGRITKDPEVRYGAQSGTAVARFSIAIDRGKDKGGNDRGADFPTMVAFGKTAELIDKYCRKGMLVGISARATTGSYEKDGRKVYTTEFTIDRIQFLSKKETQDNAQGDSPAHGIPEGFSALTDDDIPF